MDWVKFKELLQQEHHFPGNYQFRFVMKKEQVTEAMNLAGLDENQVQCRQSKKGNYISVHFSLLVDSADQVISIYQTMSKIKGVIAL